MNPFHIQTPLLESQPLSQLLGHPVFLKMEALQPTGSFKIRGIGRLCQQEYEKGARHLVASSGGNAGLAVAYAGRQLGVRVTVFVPSTTPQMMREKIEAEGATVIVEGDDWSQADQRAQKLVQEEKVAYIHPFDHPTLWEGHATMIEEIHKQIPKKPGAVALAVGGGGLLCGVLAGLQKVGWTDVPVVALETEGAASFAAAVKAGKVIRLNKIDTIAKSLGAPWVAVQALEWTKRHKIIPWVVSDREAVNAALRFADDHRVLVEPACGAALAAVYERLEPVREVESLVVIVCGGAGVTLELLRKWGKEVS